MVELWCIQDTLSADLNLPIAQGCVVTTGYETHLVHSVMRAPGELTLSMVNRLLNAGITTVGPTDLMALLERVAASPATSPPARQWAQHFRSYQQRKLNT